ncbi:MAG TPA: ExeA family protein [Candidatus Tripitaka californicus]|uniref:ExeA family protein n=1 Tax=Candidatus Tripitaka californicus TaxID=3367616 RepID=UPI0040275FB0|nr:AAA family ATPase [Planctomycetota bacterium]
MYLDYWGLKKKPFENTPNPDFFFYSVNHEEALTRLLYGVKEKKGAVMITGEIGAGKTLLSRMLVRLLSREEKGYNIAVVVNPNLTAEDLLRELIYQFGGLESLPPVTSKLDLLHRLEDIVFESNEKGQHCVLVIDEAHVIKDEAIFEEIRLLLNFQKNDAFLMTIVLLGQPELAQRVRQHEPLSQRIAIRYNLSGLSKEEVGKYVDYRLKAAGADREIFNATSVEEVYRASKGIPRIINNICDLSLLMGFSSQAEQVSDAVVKAVAEDLRLAARYVK